MIRIYPTTVMAEEDGRQVFTMTLEEEGVFNLQLHTLFDRSNIESLFDAVRQGAEILEIEK